MRNEILYGNARDVLKTLPDESVDCLICSPPYWSLRSYNVEPQEWGDWKGHLGLEENPDQFVKHLADIFDEMKRVLKRTGTMWVNLGDTYYTKSGSGFLNDNLTNNDNTIKSGLDKANEVRGKGFLPDKCLSMVPERFALEMINRGWILRNQINWVKQWTNWKTKQGEGSSMPTSVKDRLNTNSEKIFLFTKDKKYFFDLDAVRIPHKEDSIKRACRGRSEDSKSMKSGEYAVTYANKHKGYFDMKKKLEEGELRGVNSKGRNPGDCLMFPPEPNHLEHYATYPSYLPEFCLLAGCPEYVCKKCGKPREKVFEYDGLSEEGTSNVEKLSEKPYSVQERKGTVSVRKLPSLQELREYLGKWKGKFTIDEIEEKLESQAPHHWFSGESYPTKEDWIKLKELLGFDDKYDNNMLKEYYKPAEKHKSSYIQKGLSDCGCNAGFQRGIVIDPFFGSGTTGLVALKNRRDFVGIELGQEYIDIAKKRLSGWLQQKRLEDFGGK